MRIGQGFDAHRFSESGTLVLGGVTIPFERGMLAHSDGDVVLHALCDAIIGGLGEGDIGGLFPDTDERYRGIDSRELLREVVARMRTAGYAIGNVDLTVIAQVPRLKPHVEAMRVVIAADLETTPDAVNVKATTTEGMGFTGREEGIASLATVLLVSAAD